MIGKDWKSVSVCLLSHFPKKKKEKKNQLIYIRRSCRRLRVVFYSSWAPWATSHPWFLVLLSPEPQELPSHALLMMVPTGSGRPGSDPMETHVGCMDLIQGPWGQQEHFCWFTEGSGASDLCLNTQTTSNCLRAPGFVLLLDKFKAWKSPVWRLWYRSVPAFTGLRLNSVIKAISSVCPIPHTIAVALLPHSCMQIAAQGVLVLTQNQDQQQH